MVSLFLDCWATRGPGPGVLGRQARGTQRSPLPTHWHSRKEEKENFLTMSTRSKRQTLTAWHNRMQPPDCPRQQLQLQQLYVLILLHVQCAPQDTLQWLHNRVTKHRTLTITSKKRKKNPSGEVKPTKLVQLVVKRKILLHYSPNHSCVQQMPSDCRCSLQNCSAIHDNQQRYASALKLAAQNDKYNQRC